MEFNVLIEGLILVALACSTIGHGIDLQAESIMDSAIYIMFSGGLLFILLTRGLVSTTYM